MSNHIHLLIEVPDPEELAPLTEESLLAVLPKLHDGVTVTGVKQELERARLAGDGKWQQDILDRYEKRRGSLPYFVKELKQRITLYMNKKLNRTGTLWEGRYKSVLVEGNELALLTIAAYIDLNPVRAGIVEKPEDYRWCGYAEAMGEKTGERRARNGLGIILSESLQDSGMRADWRRTQKRYRLFLYEEGEEREANEMTGEGSRKGFASGEVETVIGSQGEMPMREVLRHRVRYFCDGAVLGTAEFVDDIFQRQKALGHASAKRKSGARKMRGAAWGDLRVLRDLQKEVISE